jgi:hypothetical protein
LGRARERRLRNFDETRKQAHARLPTSSGDDVQVKASADVASCSGKYAAAS